MEQLQYIASLWKGLVYSALNIMLKVGRLPRLMEAEEKSEITKKVQSKIILLWNKGLSVTSDSSSMWQK